MLRAITQRGAQEFGTGRSQKVAYFSIKGHNLLKVVKGKVVKRKR